MSEGKIRYDDHHATCPFCGFAHEGCWDWDESLMDGKECNRCKRYFACERVVVATYTTRPMRICPTCKQPAIVSTTGLIKAHMRYGADVGWCAGNGQAGILQEDRADE